MISTISIIKPCKTVSTTFSLHLSGINIKPIKHCRMLRINLGHPITLFNSDINTPCIVLLIFPKIPQLCNLSVLNTIKIHTFYDTLFFPCSQHFARCYAGVGLLNLFLCRCNGRDNHLLLSETNKFLSFKILPKATSGQKYSHPPLVCFQFMILALSMAFFLSLWLSSCSIVITCLDSTLLSQNLLYLH